VSPEQFESLEPRFVILDKVSVATGGQNERLATFSTAERRSQTT
jgi:hypothetical protein